jgi:hypothetical protein
MSSVKLANGEEANSDYVKLALYMAEKQIERIYFEYAGSGDSGAVEVIRAYRSGKDISGSPGAEFKDLEFIEGIFYKIVDPDFNNDGSYGNGEFLLSEEGILTFKCEHEDVITETRGTEYDEQLIDSSKL